MKTSLIPSSYGFNFQENQVQDQDSEEEGDEFIETAHFFTRCIVETTQVKRNKDSWRVESVEFGVIETSSFYIYIPFFLVPFLDFKLMYPVIKLCC